MRECAKNLEASNVDERLHLAHVLPDEARRNLAAEPDEERPKPDYPRPPFADHVGFADELRLLYGQGPFGPLGSCAPIPLVSVLRRLRT
jgi:hypothetical protein